MESFLENLRYQHPLEWTAIALITHLVIQLGIAMRVIMARRSVGESLAWIMIIFILPIVGPMIYLLLGELRLGSWRARRMRELADSIQQRMSALDRPNLRVNWHELGDDSEQLATAGRRLLQAPTLPGNELQLLGDWHEIFDHLIVDINAAEVNCDFEFYIWHAGGRTDDVVDAILRARKRGVTCRILVDALGSRQFLSSDQAGRLRAQGVQVQAALPGGLWRLPFVRFDLRMHRKLILIDDRIAYTGSLNMVDPRYFKQEKGVGQWIDAMVRMHGPSVEAMAVSFQTDWYIESNVASGHLPDMTQETHLQKVGTSAVQVLPSGPNNQVHAIEQLLITAIYTARHEVVITTPYFVPSEALQMALQSAADRGVKVIVILPEKVDSLLVRLASRAYKGDLLSSGVLIAQFAGGLLHTKSVVVDQKTSLFGSLNLDPRSFRLNFELTLTVFDPEFAQRLRALQQSYLDQSHLMDLHMWQQRSIAARFTENVARLFGPLL